jgi:hypothetical protein
VRYPGLEKVRQDPSGHPRMRNRQHDMICALLLQLACSPARSFRYAFQGRQITVARASRAARRRRATYHRIFDVIVVSGPRALADGFVATGLRRRAILGQAELGAGGGKGWW